MLKKKKEKKEKEKKKMCIFQLLYGVRFFSDSNEIL